MRPSPAADRHRADVAAAHAQVVARVGDVGLGFGRSVASDRDKGTEYISESGIRSGRAVVQCDRALR